MKDESTLAFCLLLTLLVPFALAGLALINSGLNRTRSAAHSVLSSVCVVAVAVLAYGALGTAIFGAGHPGHLLLIAGKPWDWIFKKFPGRTHPAIRTRWSMVRPRSE